MIQYRADFLDAPAPDWITFNETGGNELRGFARAGEASILVFLTGTLLRYLLGLLPAGVRVERLEHLLQPLLGGMGVYLGR